MSLKDFFNDRDFQFIRNGDTSLDVYKSSRAGGHYMTYDFASRILLTRTAANEGGVSVTPFSLLDPEALAVLRDKLIALGGKPPPLPATPDIDKPPLRPHKPKS